MVAMATRMSFSYSHKEYYIMEILSMIKHMNINRHQHAQMKRHKKKIMYKNSTYRSGDQLQKLKPQGPATDDMNWILDKTKNSINILMIMQSNLKKKKNT
jgi:hypothetical protein